MPLAGNHSLIRQTIDRVKPLLDPGRIRILAGPALAHPLMDELPELGPDALLLEPHARGTAPVLVWAAHELTRLDPDAVMLSLHSDHVIEPAEAFRATLARAADLAREHGRLFTLGAVPTRPETGYGYIAEGAALSADGAAHEVAQFVEKPDAVTAQEYVAAGRLWNTGIFVWPARLLLDQIRRHTPEIAAHLELLDRGDVQGFFDAVPNLTIDVGLLERSDRVAVLRADFRWDDAGAWDALARTRERDAAGNVGEGDTWLVDSENCIAWADEGSVVLFGARDLIVVRTAGVTFVAPRERAPDLKRLLAELPDRLATGE